MNRREIRLFLLEDEEAIAEREKRILERIGFQVHLCSELTEALDCLRSGKKDWDAFVIDIRVPCKDPSITGGGLHLAAEALKAFPTAPMAIVSQLVDRKSIDYALFDLQREYTTSIFRLITKPGYEKPLEQWGQRAYEILQSQIQAKESSVYHAEDPRVQSILTDLTPVAASASSLPILILGETGTGKEDLARKIHQHENNPFREGPFISVNCAAVSESTLISELYGHVKGSYTDAYEHRLGVFLEAGGYQLSAGSRPDDRHRLLEEMLHYFGVERMDQLNRVLSDENSLEDKWKTLDRFLKKLDQIRRSYEQVESYREWLERCGNRLIKVQRTFETESEDSKDSSDFEIMGVRYGPCQKKERADFYYNEAAKGGTLFLDEVGDLSLSAQVALLRALDGYGIRPHGYTGPALLPNCRIVAATNRISSIGEIESLKSPLRKDLFWRLAGWVMTLPPLRERKDREGRPEWINWLLRQAAKDRLELDESAVNQLSEDLENRARLSRMPLLGGNWRELRRFYARAKAKAESRKGSRTITQKDLAFASEWVLQAEAPSPERNSGADRISEDHPVEKWMERLDQSRLKTLCTEIWKTRGKCIDQNPDRIAIQYGAYYLRAILAIFFWDLHRKHSRNTFDEIFGFGKPPRKTVTIRQYLQNKSKDEKYRQVFVPHSGTEYYGVNDLKADGKLFEEIGMTLSHE